MLSVREVIVLSQFRSGKRVISGKEIEVGHLARELRDGAGFYGREVSNILHACLVKKGLAVMTRGASSDDYLGIKLTNKGAKVLRLVLKLRVAIEEK